MLGAAQVLGHLLVQGRLQHAFGELFEQSVGPCQVQSFFLGHAHECERRLPLGVAFFPRPASSSVSCFPLSQQTSSTSLSDRPHDRPVKASYTLRETVPREGLNWTNGFM